MGDMCYGAFFSRQETDAGGSARRVARVRRSHDSNIFSNFVADIAHFTIAFLMGRISRVVVQNGLLSWSFYKDADRPTVEYVFGKDDKSHED